MSQNPSVIVYAKRTAIGKLQGSFATTSAPQLGAALVKNAVSALSLNPSIVEEIIMGQVLTAGVGQAPARQTAIYGGLPTSVCATTVNRVCGSGIKAVMLADQAIRSGDARVVMAGGQESMSQAPHLLLGSRNGFRFGSAELKDHMQWDGLWDPYDNVAMGICGELCAKEKQISRSAQDEYAAESYRRARLSQENGAFAREIVPVEVVERKTTRRVELDEEPHAADLSKLSTLRPAFDSNGTITAANASSIDDGAALLVVMHEDAAREHGFKPLARIVAQASAAAEPKWFTSAPISAIRKVLQRARLEVKDIDLFEINEAFAVVPMLAMRELGLEHARVNPYGGAVALGHPIGASGARIIVTLLNALREKGGRYGVATPCIGGGEASAIVVELC